MMGGIFHQPAILEGYHAANQVTNGWSFSSRTEIGGLFSIDFLGFWISLGPLGPLGSSLFLGLTDLHHSRHFWRLYIMKNLMAACQDVQPLKALSSQMTFIIGRINDCRSYRSATVSVYKPKKKSPIVPSNTPASFLPVAASTPYHSSRSPPSLDHRGSQVPRSWPSPSKAFFSSFISKPILQVSGLFPNQWWCLRSSGKENWVHLMVEKITFQMIWFA